MTPAKFSEANVTLKAPKEMDNCGDLPTWTDGKTCLSCWKASWRERLIFLFTGKIWLWVVSGYTQPPVALQVEPVEFKKPLSERPPEKKELGEDDVRSIVRAVLKRERKRK